MNHIIPTTFFVGTREDYDYDLRQQIGEDKWLTVKTGDAREVVQHIETLIVELEQAHEYLKVMGGL